MILTDREIQIALSSKQIVISPEPSRDAFSSTSIDLTLSEKGKTWVASGGLPLRPGASGFKYSVAARYQKPEDITGFTMKPGSFLLAWTNEYLELPTTSRLAARVEGKSSLARLGLGIHITAPIIHAGFKGQIQLEMLNAGPNDIILDAGMKICQLIFELLSGTPESGYAGMFSGQVAQ